MKKNLIRSITGLVVALSGVAIAQAQTSIFTYQGRLNDGAAAGTGTYQMQFALFPGASTGAQIGSTLTFDGTSNPAVQVTNGIFTVQLDFGSSPFTAGADRFLEISVKHPADPGYTTLAPRQQLTASPFSIRTISAGAADSLSSNCVACVNDAQISGVDGSKVTGTVANATTANSASTATNADNASNLNNLPAGDYVQTSDSRLTDSRAPTAGSNFYIQNQPGSTQTGDFSLSGTGAANIFNATEFDINGNRMLTTQGFSLFLGYNAGPASTGLSNTFLGAFAGFSNTDGQSNTFVGLGAGKLNVHGTSNAFFGADAGTNNTESNNSFFGAAAGHANTTGSENAFFGAAAGTAVTTAPNNAFFGTFAGFSTVSNGNNSFFGAEAGFNSTGLRNSFFGAAAGNGNTSGNDNVAFGNSAGLTNTTGTNNTILGANADVSTSNLIFASAIGGSAKVSANDTIVLGKVAGTYNSVSRPADTVLIPGNLTVSGTFTAPVQNMKVAQTSAQTLSSTTSFSQVLHFDSVLFGSGPALSSDQILITEAGLYQISSQIEFASNATGYRGLAILVPSHVPAAVLLPAVSGNDTILTTSSLVRLNVNDFVKVEALQNSGGNLATVVNDQGAAFLSVVRVGP